MPSELSSFLPYLLNQAAEAVSREFQPRYRDIYGMLRTEWRVLFHLGRREHMTAKQICDEAMIHKTKVSRAVRALEEKRYIQRTTIEDDRRSEKLALTKSGRAVFDDLSHAAASFDDSLADMLGTQEVRALKSALNRLIEDRANSLR